MVNKKYKQNEKNKKMNKLYLIVIMLTMTREESRTLFSTEERVHATKKYIRKKKLIKADCE